ncbi:Uncharacterised protein [Vibrio cholerae]|nr:Uncharacterised protein [Vibrio cholerae]
MARIALLPAIGSTSRGIVRYHTTMYSLIRGISSWLAPSSKNSGSMVNKPSVEAAATSNKASSNP